MKVKDLIELLKKYEEDNKRIAISYLDGDSNIFCLECDIVLNTTHHNGEEIVLLHDRRLPFNVEE